ncbi:Glycoside hydrolase family 5 protein [Mycena kentingensis (nom. inval.)]|nr:Glycoside hydrolase family 5 protein [Mycena kentingensis (nom. inval.)]
MLALSLLLLLFAAVAARLDARDSCDSLKSIPLQDAPVPPFPPYDSNAAQVYRYRQQRAVNLGSWFVLENWMTPSMFPPHAISEHDVVSSDPISCSRRRLERHWDSWIEDSDLRYLASIGINTVRLPIGYWGLGPDYCKDTPFADVADVYTNAWSAIVRAINTAESHGIGVLVDLHAAPGSQNGQPHSGVSDKRIGTFSPEYRSKTIDVLRHLVEQLCNVTNVVGIQILNEPQDGGALVDFYKDAIDAMRAISPAAARFPLYIHDGFNLNKFSRFVAGRSDFVVQDHHSYFVFTPQDDQKSASQHTRDVATVVQDALKNANRRGNLIIGEWSCALTPLSLSQEQDPDAARRAFCTTQLDTYTTSTAGWHFWSYKLETCEPGWCFVKRALPSNFFWSTCGARSTSTDNRDSGSGLLGRASNLRHRAATIYAKRQNMSPEQESQATGYSDGLQAARMFCAYDSRLGFLKQYMLDRIRDLGDKVVASGTEQAYEQGFEQGYSDGENEEY